MAIIDHTDCPLYGICLEVFYYALRPERNHTICTEMPRDPLHHFRSHRPLRTVAR